MCPASMSAWLTVYVAVQLIFAPGTSVAGVTGVQARPGSSGSLTVTPVRLVLPVLVALIVYVIAWPRWSYAVGLAVLATVRAESCVAVTVAVSVAATGPLG